MANVSTVDTQWFAVAMFVVQVLVSIILALIGFGMRLVMSDLKEVTKELRSFQKDVFINGDSVMRTQFEEYRRETRTRLHNLTDRLGACEGVLRVLHKIDMPVKSSE